MLVYAVCPISGSCVKDDCITVCLHGCLWLAFNDRSLASTKEGKFSQVPYALARETEVNLRHCNKTIDECLGQ